MDILITAGKVLLFALAIANVVLILRAERGNLGFAMQIWRRFRFGMFLQCLLLIVLTVVVGVTLVTYVPGLQFGWLNLFIEGGGNIAIAPITDSMTSEYQLLRLVPIIFFLAFLVIIPFAARSEEKMFRKGHTSWKSIWWQSTKFGLVHCVVGIPIGFGIALIMTGLFYAYHYKRACEQRIWVLGRTKAEEEAVLVSTTYHAMYNSILTLLLVVAIIMAF